MRALKFSKELLQPEELQLRLDIGMDAGECVRRVRAAIWNGAPARSTATCSNSSVVGLHPSSKMAAAFAFEAGGEQAALLLADVLERVVAYRPQSVRVRFMHEGASCTAYPDIAVSTIDGAAELWECKPSGKLRGDRLARLVSLYRALRSVGIAYRIRQPHWSRRQPRAANAALLWSHARTPLPEGARAAVLEAISGGAGTLGALRRAVDLPTRALLGMAARGDLAIEIGARPIGDLSLVREPKPNASSGGFDAAATQGLD